MTEPIPAAESYIGWRLSDLAERNQHHQFEEIATRIARKRISSNILVATGPVSAGGDQGRDAESYTTRIPDELPHSAGFSASASTSPVVVACTIQRTGLKRKVLDDLASICRDGATSPDIVALFSVHPIPEATTHELQGAARDEYGVTLEIFSGNKVANLLAEPDLIWVARHYLELPSDLEPEPEGETAPEWYAELLDDLRRNRGPAAMTPAAQGEVIRGLRHATWDKTTNAELPEWLDFMAAFLSDTAPADEGDGDTDLVFHACYEMSVARFRGMGVADGVEDLVRRAVDFACTSHRPDILDDAVTLVSYWGVMWVTGVGRANAAEIAAADERLRAHIVAELDGTDRDANPVRAATLLGTLASLHLHPNWDRAEAQRGTPEPVEVAAHVGVKFSDDDADTSFLTGSGLVDFDEAMTYLEQLADLLPSARPYSARTLSRVFDMFTPTLASHPGYAKVRDALDTSLSAVEGDAAIADKARKRGMALYRADKPLEALHEFHNAKVRWFHGSTMYGSVMTMRFIGNVYDRLGLIYAAKLYACSAAAIAHLNPDPEVKNHLPKALMEAAQFTQHGGCWLDSAALTELALHVQDRHASAPFDFEKHPDLDTLSENELRIAGLIRAFWPHLEHLLAAEHQTSGWYQLIDEQLSEPQNEVPFTEPEFLDLAAEQFAGPVLSDLGLTRIIDFKALGTRWVFTFRNDRTTVLTTEGLVAAFQILLADAARHHPVLVSTTVRANVTVVEGAPGSTNDVQLAETASGPQLAIRLSNDTSNFEESSVLRTAVAFQLLQAVHAGPQHALAQLTDDLFREGLSTKVIVGRPYEDAADLIPANHYTRCSVASRPSAVEAYEPNENEHLKASTQDGPEYDNALALTRIRERYEVVQRSWHLTVAEFLGDDRGRATIRRLQEEGWKDWQILMGIANVGVGLRMQAAGLDPETATYERARPLMDHVETPDEPRPSIDLLLARLDHSMAGQLLTIGQGWDVHSPTALVDVDAMRDLLERRYHYAQDDLPHRDLLECRSEDGTLLPLLEPEDGTA
ncbi:hypothetical protein [Nocardioides zeicaulis]|uniref:Uncharacterized protein n=1 Tax=Nocardioides zeicaulis TaxID=1776857 RepID=A0ABV6E6Z0_9ACTN